MKHNHSCECDHNNVQYCKKCKVVHCLECNQEWRTYPSYTYNYPYNYPYYWYGQTGQLGSQILMGNATGQAAQSTNAQNSMQAVCNHQGQ